MSRVASAQRFSAAHPCPVCGGHDGLPRGESVRCAGFRSDDGRWAHCTREEHAGGLRVHDTSLTYAHRLDIPCRCGRPHDTAPRPLAGLPISNGPVPVAPRRRVATYDYRTSDGRLLHRTLRYDPKGFGQCRPDPDRSEGWIPNLDGVAPVLYRLPEIQGHADVVLVEGEKDAEALAARGFVASCNVMGAGKWRAAYAQQLVAAGVQRVAVIPDNDRVGRDHAAAVAASCVAAGLTARVVPLPGLPPVCDTHGEDVSDWLAQGHTADELRDLLRAPVARPPKATPWTRALSVTEFLSQEEQAVTWLEQYVVSPGALTEIFSPRGLGKSHLLHGILVNLARHGRRCLLLDRDNARREVQRRLRAWGAEGLTTTLRVMCRDDVPPLTDTKAWAEFPVADYDVVAIDSLDATAEGVGEQDSAKPARALAPVLDLCHRADGPAVVVLGNVIKSGAHSRGSGVVEDRADIAYEVRDATGFTPSGTRDWWLELPAAGVEQWATRATRRKRRDTYRLAFVSSKFRIGEEPDPFVYELNLGTEPWGFRLCTEDILAAGTEARETAAQERAARLEAAATALRALLTTSMTSAAAEQYLKSEHRLRRADARALLAAKDGVLWTGQIDATKPGRPRLWQALATAAGGRFQEGSAAESPARESPVSTPSGERDIFAGRMDTPRRDSPPAETRVNSGDSAEVVSAAEPGLKGAPGPGEERL